MAKHKVADGVPINERPAMIDGVKVSLRQPAYAPHPNPSQNGKLVETRGVTHVLLENGRELYECNPCLKTFERVRSAVAHLTAHNPDRGGSMYSDAVLRHIMRLIAEARANGIRGFNQYAAERLNESGTISTAHGEPWTAGAVHNLHQTYGAQFPVRIRRPRTPRTPPTAAESATPAPRRTTVTDSDPWRRAEKLMNRVQAELTDVRRFADALGATLAELRDAVNSIPQVAPPAEPDPELVKKAAHYDTLMSAIKNAR